MQCLHDKGVVHSGDAVSDALHTEQINGLAHGFGAAGLASMDEAVQALLGRIVIDAAELRRGQGELIAAHAEGHDAFGVHLRGEACDFHGRGGAELSRGVENPVHAQAFALRAPRGFADGPKIRLDVLLAAEHHADGKRDFGIDNVLLSEPLGQALGNERVVGRSAEEGGDPLEGFEEAQEVVVVVARGGFGRGQGHAVARGKLGHGFGLDRAFEVEVKFGFGQCGEQRGQVSCVHVSGLLLRKLRLAGILPGGQPV